MIRPRIFSTPVATTAGQRRGVNHSDIGNSTTGRRRAAARRFALVLAVMFAAAPTLAAPRDIAVESAELRLGDNGYLIDADVSFHFHANAIEALQSGIAIVVELDIKFTQPRRYWWDRKISNVRRKYSIQKHALSQQFVLSDLTSGERRVHRSLEVAIADLGRIRDLPVAKTDDLDLNPVYDVSLRMRLDIESLPAPLIPIAWVSPSWHMSSGWYQWKTDL